MSSRTWWCDNGEVQVTASFGSYCCIQGADVGLVH